MAQPRKARAGLAFIYGIVGFSLIGLLAIALRGKIGTPAGDAYEAKRAADRRTQLAEIRKTADEKLHSAPSWVNKEKGIVRIPIADAMSITIKTLGDKEVKASSVKAEPVASLIVPPYLTKAEEPAAKDGETKEEPQAASQTAPAEGAAKPAGESEGVASNVQAALTSDAAGEGAPATPSEEAPAANPAN